MVCLISSCALQVIDFQEFMIILLVFDARSKVEALEVIFDFLDGNDNGTIDKKEMGFVVSVLYETMKNDKSLSSELTAEGMTNEIFSELDNDGSDTIDRDEFVEKLSNNSSSCKTSNLLCEQLLKLFGPEMP